LADWSGSAGGIERFFAMNPRNTFALVVLTAAIFAFIFLVEPRFQKPKLGPPRVLPDLNTNTLTAVQVLTPQFEIRAERAGRGWRLIKPLAYPAQNATVEAFLIAVMGLPPQFQITAQELQNHPSVNEEYGLDTPLATLVFQQTGEQPRQLKLGKFTAPGDGMVDFKALFKILAGAGYDGWLVQEAEQDPRMAHPFTYAEQGNRHLRELCAASGLKAA